MVSEGPKDRPLVPVVAPEDPKGSPVGTGGGVGGVLLLDEVAVKGLDLVLSNKLPSNNPRDICCPTLSIHGTSK